MLHKKTARYKFYKNFLKEGIKYTNTQQTVEGISYIGHQIHAK